MYKFYTSAWFTFRQGISRTISQTIFKSFSCLLKCNPLTQSLFANLLKTPRKSSTTWHSKFHSRSSTSQRATLGSGVGLAMILSIFSQKSKSEFYKNAYEVEKAISDIVTKAESMVLDEKLSEAKLCLLEALKLAEETRVYSNISSVYDLLSTIAFKEGGITEAEDMLVKFIEKLIQLGYPENHNSIVRFKLKLSRLYQSVGNREMAELGFRDCINAQEDKIFKSKVNDELTNLIYVSSLFWYGKFLTQHGDFKKAKHVLKKALNSLDQTKSVSPAQVMVVLYYNAEVAYILKEYDDSLTYLYQAINLCRESDPENPDLPLYLIKVGFIHMIKGLYDEARFWCEAGGKMANLSKNEDAQTEANLCIETLEKVIANPELRSHFKSGVHHE